MKAILICPGERGAVAALSERTPLSNVLILGKPLIEYWLEHLVTKGAREVLVLANDRPEHVHARVGQGSRWGLELAVFSELRELTPKEAVAAYQRGVGWMPGLEVLNTMDYLPGFRAYPLFDRYAGFAAGQCALMPCVATPDRIGLREVEPGIWIGLRSQVSKSAHLMAPCWIGDEAFIANEAVIGPMAVVEVRSVVEAGAAVINSIVGPDTLIGEHAAIRCSIAWGSTLINCQHNSRIQVADSFLISSLAKRPAANLPGRFSGLLPASGPRFLDLARLPGWDVEEGTTRAKIQRKNGVLVVEGISELNAASLRTFRQAIATSARLGLPTIEVDLSRVVSVDAHALGILSSLYPLAEGRRPPGVAPVRLINPQPAVLQMLELARMDLLFEIIMRQREPDETDFVLPVDLLQAA